MPTQPHPTLNVSESVRERYAAGAEARQPELCCPVDYDARLLAVLPPEIIERDYGCGDPSRFVKPGEVVLDLGSGAGKICFMASQLAGAEGRVIGVDATPEMLALSRRWAPEIGTRIGWQNVEFRHAHIQDLSLDRDKLETFLAAHPARDLASLEALEREQQRLRSEEPLIADESVDLVLSNCVLNLVDNREKRRLFHEIQRVLKRGGRCAISDIVSDEPVPEEMQNDPELWSGCISGAMQEHAFLEAFAEAGLYGIQVESYQQEPWAVVRGIEFRSMTVVAYKGKQGPCMDHNEAVIYRGPWKEVVDDDGHVLLRGQRTAVCRKTARIYAGEPYASQITSVPPLVAVPEGAAPEFDCRRSLVREARETKAGLTRPDLAPGTTSGSDNCAPSDGGCC